MPKKTEAATPEKTIPPSPGEEAGLDSLAWMGTAWIEAISDMGSELASFVADRIREDVKTQHAILHCKSVSEMQAIQVAFMERAYEQYTAETGKLIEKSTALFPQFSGQTKNTPL